MPGIRVEKLTASMVISRFMRRATSVKRSIWNPSTPPPSLGMACGAKVAPILSESTEQVKPGPRGAGVRPPRSRREARDEVVVGIYCGPVRATVGSVGPHLVDGHGGRG